MITIQEMYKKCLGGVPSDSPEFKINVQLLHKGLNIFRKEYGKPMVVSCFYRTPEWDKDRKRSGTGPHTTGEACDFYDPDGSIDAFAMTNIKLLEGAGLSLEHPSATPGWAHFDIRVRKSGNRVFMP